MCEEYKKFWHHRAQWHGCDECGQEKPARDHQWSETLGRVMSQCWDCYAEEQYPVSLQGILFQEVQEFLKKNGEWYYPTLSGGYDDWWT